MNGIHLPDALMLVCMLIVLARCICIVPLLSRAAWTGSRGHFAALAGTYALLAGGAVGTALHASFGPLLLLLAVAGWVVFDRRRPR